MVVATIAFLVMTGCGDAETSVYLRSGAPITQPPNAAGGLTLTVSTGEERSLAYAETDRDFYIAGESGIATFLNSGDGTLFLSGCAPFVFEQSLDGAWSFVGPPFVCLWEGIAIPVGRNETDSIEFTIPRESGVYRLRYDYSAGCELGVPLSEAHCAANFATYSNIFEVGRELCDLSQIGCRASPGPSNILCSDGMNVSGPSSECTRDSETGQCGYEFLSCP